MTKTRRCPTCGSEFPATRGRRYCSELCWPSRRLKYGDPDASTGSGDEHELMELLWSAARRGSVQAMQVLRREMAAAPAPQEPRSVIDDLARRRS